MTDITPTGRSRVKRHHERGAYDFATIAGILDAAFICHVGYAIDGQPYVTPTSFWRDRDLVYWHGSSASRMLRTLERGIDCCFTVTIIDGLVLARSAFNHSVNYRSVMLFGRASLVDEPTEKLRQLELFTQRMYPGRWSELRPVTPQEIKATTVLSMRIEDGAAKVRSGPPKDDAEDLDWPVWAGVVPVHASAGHAVPDNAENTGAAQPSYLRDLTHIGLEPTSAGAMLDRKA
jgi:nitroimidazol reductase NimA-like FMN-containing flavoprotein (pyridoxamine 5'-phosphate oxidase superfamily)